MPDLRLLADHAACEGKQRFETAESARKALYVLQRVAGFSGRQKPYECPLCKGFHYGQPRQGVAPVVIGTAGFRISKGFRS